MKQRVLIIGGTGFFGYHLAVALKKKYNVTSLSKNKPKKIRKIIGLKYLYADITKKKQILFLNKKKFEYIINCSGYVNHIDKKQNFNNHFIGCKNIVKIFKKKLKLFIQIGSSAEYGKICSPQKEDSIEKAYATYGKSKLLATKFLRSKTNLDFPFVVLRFYQLYGPKQDSNRFIPYIIKSCIKDETFSCTNCKQYRDFLYIDDAVDAVKKCIDNSETIKRKIINIGYGKPYKLRKIVNIIRKKTKKGNPNFGKILMRSDEMMKLYPSLFKSKKYLKWKPSISLYSGINKTIQYFKSQDE